MGKTMKICIHLVIGLCLLFVVSGSLLAHEKPHAAAPLKKDASKGEKLYNEFSCVSCHGARGEGMDGPPLNSTAFKKKYHTDEDLKKVILNGLPPKEGQTAVMVGLGDAISEEELEDLIVYIRSLKPSEASTPANHQH